jgi:predicted alpha/beta hydrolase family esterase
MAVERVIIVHGHASSPLKYWFTNLAEELKKTGIREVLIPWMPHPYFPTIRSWKKRLASIIGNSGAITAVIGHSFGAISALRLAEDTKIHTIISISTPVRWVWHPWLRARFLYREPQWQLLQANIQRHLIIQAIDDWIAPLENANYLHQKLFGEVMLLNSGGHLCSETLPSLAQKRIFEILELDSNPDSH